MPSCFVKASRKRTTDHVSLVIAPAELVSVERVILHYDDALQKRRRPHRACLGGAHDSPLDARGPWNHGFHRGKLGGERNQSRRTAYSAESSAPPRQARRGPRAVFVASTALLLLAFAGCGSAESVTTITLATTTSTRDSGLLDVLVPRFQQQTGIEVKVVAVGSGQALEMGRRGDADVLLTHAPDAEKQFVAEGYGTGRRLVMHNDFVLVGPKSDPAKVSGEKSITAAFTQIAQSQSPFVSRGDDSGTHKKETSVWKQAGTAPQGDGYLQSGSGMAATLRIASEKRAYTLSDRGTFLAQQERLDLAILSAGDPLLRNQYAAIVVDPKKHPHVNADAARQFADFLLLSDTQKTIGNFGVEKFGQPLFFPNDAKP